MHVDSTRDKLLTVGQRISNSLSDYPEVTAILITGSTALGHVDERSDIDIIVITRSTIMPACERSSRLSTLGHSWQWDILTGNAIFGERADKDGVVDNKQVTVCYQTVPVVSETVSEVLNNGALSTAYMPFRPYTLIALLQRCILLVDKDDLVAGWRSQSRHYPPCLKQNIQQAFMPSLQEATDELVATAERKLGALGFLFHLNHAVDALLSLLYALNEVYDPAERRAQLVILPTLQQVPHDFINQLTDILEGPFDPIGALQRAYQFRQLVQEVLDC